MSKEFKFRDYQEKSYKIGLRILNRVSKAKTKKMVSGMIVNPTGAGKGFLVGKLSEDVSEPILVLQPSKELLEQNFIKFEIFGGKATVCCSSLTERTRGGIPYTTINGREMRSDEISEITFGTIGSLTSRIPELKELGIKKVIIDECFPAGTPIRTECGVMTIRQIHNKIQEGGTVRVNSYNEKEEVFELKEVIGSKSNGVKEVIKLSFTNLTFECTRNHKIRTLSGWKSAEDLKLGEAVLTSYGKDNVGSYIELKKVEEVGKKKEVFDLEVEGNHNFTITSKAAQNYLGKREGVSGGGVVVHNCHLNSKPDTRLKKFLEDLGVTNILGLTATPFYLNGGMEGSRIQMINRTKGTIFKSIDHVVQISDINKEYWSPLEYSLIKVDQKYLSINSSGTGYTEVSLRDFFQNNNMYDRISQEVSKAKKEGRKKIVIFVPTIEEAEILHKKIRGSLIVHSKMPTDLRKAMVDDFSYGKGDVIINVSVLSVGYDHSEIDYIIDAAPTNSIASFYQKLGRGVRQGKKDNCNIVDMAGNVGRFGKIEELKIEEDDDHGWGLFNEKGEILSHYSCNIFPRPIRGKEHSNDLFFVNSEDKVFTFGKFKGKTIEEVLKAKGGKGYCLWMTKEDSEFQPQTRGMKNFVGYIRQALIDLEREPQKDDKKEVPMPF